MLLSSSSSSSDEDDDDDDETAIQPGCGIQRERVERHDIFSLSSSPESAVQPLPASAVQPLSAHKSDSIALNTVAFDVSGSQVCTIVVE